MESDQARREGAHPLGVAARIGASAFLSMFILAGAFFAWRMARDIRETVQTYGWPATPCRIAASSIVEESNRDEAPYTFHVNYEYDWDGQTFTNVYASVRTQTFSDYAEAQALLARYPAGGEAVCYVNPSLPAQAVLIHGKLWGAVFLVVPLVFMLVGAGGVYFVWRVQVADPRSAESRDVAPLSDRARATGGERFLLVFFGLFLVAGAVVSHFLLVKPIVGIVAARSWVATPCVVETSQLRRIEGDESTTYRVDVLYRYEFNGVTHRSNRYHFMGGSSSGYAGKRKVVRAYPRGAEATCYVNPDNPAQAVLHRGWSVELWFGLIPAAFLLTGLVGVTYTLRRKRRRRGGAPGQAGLVPERGAAPGAGAGGQRGLPQPTAAGPVELKAKHTGWAKLLGIICIAAFWNGIVSVFVWQAIKAWSSGRGGFMEKWFLPIFLIPFVLIGLVLLGAIVHQTLALFNPRPRLRVNAAALPLGGVLELQWRMDGRVQVLRRLRIWIEGREEAHYRRGTSSCTDKHTFAAFDLVNSTTRSELRSGRARLTVPAATMHSFDAPNNKVIWTLHVNGDIDWWPDVEDEFAFTVLPAAPSKG